MEKWERSDREVGGQMEKWVRSDGEVGEVRWRSGGGQMEKWGYAPISQQFVH